MLAALMTMVLPEAIHSGAIQPMGIMAGKLNGTIPANTPIGSRYRLVSMPEEASIRFSPASSVGMEQASSVPSLAFNTSPCASPQALPFSRATSSVSRSSCLISSSRIWNMICARFIAGVFAQAGNALRAAAMAALTSSSVHQGALAMTSPVLGLRTSIKWVVLESSQRPPTKYCNVFTVDIPIHSVMFENLFGLALCPGGGYNPAGTGSFSCLPLPSLAGDSALFLGRFRRLGLKRGDGSGVNLVG